MNFALSDRLGPSGIEIKFWHFFGTRHKMIYCVLQFWDTLTTGENFLNAHQSVDPVWLSYPRVNFWLFSELYDNKINKFCKTLIDLRIVGTAC